MLHQPTLLLDRIHLHKSHRRSAHASQIASVSAAFTSFADISRTLALEPGEQFYTDARRSTSASFPHQATIST
jgi:hypothetical protein